jgi:zinc protease
MASVMNIRLREALREDLGGTYGVSVGGSLSNRPIESFTVSVAFGADPDRMEELVDALFADIERLKADGPSERDVASVREIQRRERETALRTNGFWIDQIVSLTREGEDLGRVHEFDQLVDSVTPERIRDAARRWIPADNYVRVTLLPAAGATPAAQ